MYDYIKDKEFLGKLRRTCSDLINQLVQYINSDKKLKVEMNIVGSGARNLETQNSNEPVDLDYNLVILKSYFCNINDCKEIKEYVRKAFNNILNQNEWGDCMDSTSSLTTGKMHFVDGNQTSFSIDLAIILKANNTWYRLIHEKTGFTYYDRYFWNEGPHSKDLDKKVDWIKKNGYWDRVRTAYLNKKNLYLTSGDQAHPSFVCYIEAVNEVYNRAR